MKKKRFYVFVFFMVNCFFCAYSLSWPTDIINFLTLFGQSEEPNGEFSQGLIFKDAGTVRISNYGRHLITIKKSDNESLFTSTLCNSAIFVHDDGMQTVYGNLEDTLFFAEGTKMETGSILGQAGHSAWGEPASLLFQVIDTINNAFINPLPLLIPSAQDTIPPQIQNTVLISSENQVINLAEVKTLKKGAYDLYSAVTDKSEKNGVVLAPYRVSVSVNGINAAVLPFEVLLSKDGSIYLQSVKLTAGTLYREKGLLYLGSINFISGKTELSINARDINGNEKSERFSFQAE